MKIAIVGAGWAGMAAAVTASEAGHTATVFEAARSVGGRARGLNGALPDGTPVSLDNGQHILIGAYRNCLRLMRQVGVRPEDSLLRLPLTLQYPDGQGLVLPRWPSPWDTAGGILRARGWSWADKGSLLRSALRWQRAGFACDSATSVADLCKDLRPRIHQTLIEPLCVSALNTPPERASGQVFLRVLHDALLGGQGASHLLLPTVDLSALFPQAAAQWLATQGGNVRLGTRVEQLCPAAAGQSGTWWVNGAPFDAVVWATSSSNAAAALVEHAELAPEWIANSLRRWAATAAALHYEAITTVYAWAAQARLAQPMLTLRHAGHQAPAQFVFDRAQLGGPAGLLAFVVSASTTEREALQAQVLHQARSQLGLDLQAVQTVVEKRATFACTPGLQRPAISIAPALVACGDYIEGPYPATLEGAVRSGCDAIKTLVETT